MKSLLTSCILGILGRDIYYNCRVRTSQIEDYRPGYPRFSALIGAHPSFQIHRRFSNLRARLLLLKQDKLSILEQQLQEIDANERSSLFLGCSRDDQNQERSTTLLEIDRALVDYDNFVERSYRMLSSKSAEPRDVQSLQNWVDGNGCLSWEESEYLTHCNDLRRLVPIEDDAAAKSEAWIEGLLGWFQKKYQKNLCPNLSRDPHILICSTLFISRAARMLITSLVVIILSVPIIVCRSVSSSLARLAVIILSLIVFLLVLSGFVTRRTNELFLAGATYATVLVVFVSSTNMSVN